MSSESNIQSTVTGQADDLRKTLDVHVQKLFWEATQIQDEFNDAYDKAKKIAKERDEKKGGRAYLHIKLRPDTKTLEITWRLYQTTTKSDVTITREIKKGAGIGYTDATLRRYFESWEFEIVLHAEKKLKVIRAKTRKIGSAKRYLNEIKKRIGEMSKILIEESV